MVPELATKSPSLKDILFAAALSPYLPVAPRHAQWH
jgi:hypothetical protein